jgi:hypothetical protein
VVLGVIWKLGNRGRNDAIKARATSVTFGKYLRMCHATVFTLGGLYFGLFCSLKTKI